MKEGGKSMKCPACGADMEEGAVCELCGKKPDDVPDKVEVEYKDFKISEFLEIRPKFRTGRNSASSSSDVPGRTQTSYADAGAGKMLYRFIPVIIILAFAAGIILVINHFSLW